MDIGIIIYFVLGLVLTLYWYERDYRKKYEELEQGEGVEKGMAN